MGISVMKTAAHGQQLDSCHNFSLLCVILSLLLLFFAYLIFSWAIYFKIKYIVHCCLPLVLFATCICFCFFSLLTLVAEKATPSLLAVALPWLLARPVKASWVTNALVTVSAFEAHSAPVTPSKKQTELGL